MILAILQARVSSSRLPGKILIPILDRPMLLRQIERIKRAELIDTLVVATSNDMSDNPVAELCKQEGILFFRGSLQDVLSRFYDAALEYEPKHIVRLTGDCPLADPAIIDEVISFHLQGGFDYSSNALDPTFPDGLDVEVFQYRCLKEAWTEARLPSQREHVTLFIHSQPERYRLGSYQGERDLSALRWTVDEPNDFEFVKQVYERLFHQNPNFTSKDIYSLLIKEPELIKINSMFERNEGLRKSILEDELKTKGWQ